MVRLVICSRLTGPRFPLSPYFFLSTVYFSHPCKCLKLSMSLTSQPVTFCWFATSCLSDTVSFFSKQGVGFHSSGHHCCFVSYSYRSARVSVCHSQWKMRSKVSVSTKERDKDEVSAGDCRCPGFLIISLVPEVYVSINNPYSVHA